MTTDVIVSSSAEEARDPVVGTNRACSNRRSEEYKYGCSISETAGRYMPQMQIKKETIIAVNDSVILQETVEIRELQDKKEDLSIGTM